MACIPASCSLFQRRQTKRPVNGTVNLIDEAPAVEQLRVKRRVEWVPSIQEMVAVYNHINPRLRPLLRLLCETGCRKSEAFRLTWRKVDEVRGTVTFEDTKNDASVRRTPISLELLNEIRSLPKTCEYVFESKVKGQPIDNMRKALASAVVRQASPIKAVQPKSHRRRSGRPSFRGMPKQARQKASLKRSADMPEGRG